MTMPCPACAPARSPSCPTPAPRPARPGRTALWVVATDLLAGALLVCAIVATAGSPAGAHDSLVRADPADGSVLAQPPAAVTLEFSDPPLDVSPQVVVRGADGGVVADVVPTITDRTATAPLPQPLAPGTYTVAWRVVSGDGHPIEGSLGFTVQGPSTPAPTASTPPASRSAGATPLPTAALSAVPTSAPTAGAGTTSSGPGTGWWVAGGVLLVAAVAWGLRTRRTGGAA